MRQWKPRYKELRTEWVVRMQGVCADQISVFGCSWKERKNREKEISFNNVHWELQDPERRLQELQGPFSSLCPVTHPCDKKASTFPSTAQKRPAYLVQIGACSELPPAGRRGG